MKKLRKDLGLHDSFEVLEDPYFRYEQSLQSAESGAIQMTSSRRIDHSLGSTDTGDNTKKVK
jgi:hypothetical protein